MFGKKEKTPIKGKVAPGGGQKNIINKNFSLEEEFF